jgi:hypothetical protein
MSLVSVLGCGTWSFPIEEQLYYLLHMALCEGRVDALVDAWEQRGYEVQIAETLLRYTFGPQQAYFAVFWVAHDRAPGRPTTPTLHLIPDDSGLPWTSCCQSLSATVCP